MVNAHHNYDNDNPGPDDEEGKHDGELSTPW